MLILMEEMCGRLTVKEILLGVLRIQLKMHFLWCHKMLMVIINGAIQRMPMEIKLIIVLVLNMGLFRKVLFLFLLTVIILNRMMFIKLEEIRMEQIYLSLWQLILQWNGLKPKRALWGGEGLNFLTTSHYEGAEHGIKRLYSGQLYAGYTIREISHIHPDNTPYPSGSFDHSKYGKTGEWGDVGISAWIINDRQKRGLSNPIFKIYLPSSKSYINYGPNSKRSDYGK